MLGWLDNAVMLILWVMTAATLAGSVAMMWGEKMDVLVTYSECQVEYQVLSTRYNYLMNKKAEISQMLLGIHSPSLEKIGGSNPSELGHKVILFNEEINVKKQPNGKTINEEMMDLEKKMDRLVEIMKEIESVISRIRGIEAQLFYQIMINGLKPTEAVEKVARENYISQETAWRKYRNIKNLLTVK